MQEKKSIETVLNATSPGVILRSLVLLLVLLYTGLPLAAAGVKDLLGEDLGEEELARLEGGEILLQTLHGDKPGAAARVTALFHGDANAVWDIIGYCKYQLVYIRGLRLCEMLEGDQFQMIMHHRLRNSWYTPTLDFTFEARREPGGQGQASLVEGNLKVLEGRWKFLPFKANGGVMAIHEIRIQPKIPAPRWLIRRSLRKDLPAMLACIRALASASGNNDQLKADLKRCPGKIPGALK